MKELELAIEVLNWLTADGWDCYPEAQFRMYGSRADIAAVKDNLLWIVEVKKTLSMDLLAQAYKWVSCGPTFVSIAVPYSEKRRTERLAYKFCEDRGIGIIKIHKGKYSKRLWIEEEVQPRVQRHNYNFSKRFISCLHEDMKRYSPGSTTDHGRSTPWSRTMERIEEYILKNPGSTMKEIIDNVENHYPTPSTARSCLYKWLRNGNKFIVDGSEKPHRYYLRSDIHETR